MATTNQNKLNNEHTIYQDLDANDALYSVFGVDQPCNSYAYNDENQTFSSCQRNDSTSLAWTSLLDDMFPIPINSSLSQSTKPLSTAQATYGAYDQRHEPQVTVTNMHIPRFNACNVYLETAQKESACLTEPAFFDDLDWNALSFLFEPAYDLSPDNTSDTSHSITTEFRSIMDNVLCSATNSQHLDSAVKVSCGNFDTVRKQGRSLSSMKIEHYTAKNSLKNSSLENRHSSTLVRHPNRKLKKTRNPNLKMDRSEATSHVFICKLCLKVFNKKYNLRIHSKTHDINRIKEHECDKCGKSYYYRKDLTKHKKLVNHMP